MKRMAAVIFVMLAMVLCLVGCAGKEEKEDREEKESASSIIPAQDSQEEKEDTENIASGSEDPSNTPVSDGGGDRSDWGYIDYADYTGGVPEPEFAYTISGILNDQLAFQSEATADEINAWKQTLLDNGAEEVREGDTWAVIDGAHLIEMNGITNGVARIYISLDDRPVGGGEQPEQSEVSAPAADEPDNSSEEIVGEPWPENEFTSLVPKPENATVVNHMSVAGNDYTVVMAMTLEDAYAYAQQLVAAGFEGDAEMLKSNSRMYYGTNADGVDVEIMWNSETEVMLNIYAAPA